VCRRLFLSNNLVTTLHVFAFTIFRACMPRAQNTKLVQAITITYSSAMLEQARHVISCLDMTCRVMWSGIWSEYSFQYAIIVVVVYTRPNPIYSNLSPVSACVPGGNLLGIHFPCNSLIESMPHGRQGPSDPCLWLLSFGARRHLIFQKMININCDFVFRMILIVAKFGVSSVSIYKVTSVVPVFLAPR